MAFRPALLYRSEYWTFRKDHSRKMQISEKKMFHIEEKMNENLVWASIKTKF